MDFLPLHRCMLGWSQRSSLVLDRVIEVLLGKGWLLFLDFGFLVDLCLIGPLPSCFNPKCIYGFRLYLDCVSFYR